MLTLHSDRERRDLQTTRLYYFLMYAGLGFMSPFISLFYVHQGLNGIQIGWVTSLGALITLIAAPFWTNRSAHWRDPRRVLQILLVFCALSYLWLSQQQLFWAIMAVNAFRSAVSAGNMPLSDSLALAVTHKSGAGYGSVRVWGSFGWMVLVPVSGWLVQQTSLVTSMVGAAIVTFCAALVLFPISKMHFLPVPQADQPSADFRHLLTRLLTDPLLIGIAAMLIVMGLGNSGVLQFENVYLSQLGASDGLIGIAGMLSSVVEVPCMLWSDRLVTRYGAFQLLTLSMALFVGLRLLVLIFPSVAAILLTRALTGFAFSFYTVSITRLIAERSAPHETRTTLALFTITLASLVNMTGAPLAGVVFDRFGGRWLYVMAAAGYALAFFSLRMAGRRSRQPIIQAR